MGVMLRLSKHGGQGLQAPHFDRLSLTPSHTFNGATQQ